MDVSTVLEFFKEISPLINTASFATFLLLYSKIRDIEATISLLDGRVTRYLERTVATEQDLKEITSFVYSHYNLTPENALKYLHRHNGCQSVEK